VIILPSRHPGYCLIMNMIHHHHKHQGLGHLARSVSRVTAALANVSSVSQLCIQRLLVNCSGMILKEFGFVTFFAGEYDYCK
jgi:hypothetical protein